MWVDLSVAAATYVTIILNYSEWMDCFDAGLSSRQCDWSDITSLSWCTGWLTRWCNDVMWLCIDLCCHGFILLLPDWGYSSLPRLWTQLHWCCKGFDSGFGQCEHSKSKTSKLHVHVPGNTRNIMSNNGCMILHHVGSDRLCTMESSTSLISEFAEFWWHSST